MQDFLQKINPQGGINQFTGTGSPEGVVTGYVGQWYLDTAANSTYRKDSGDNTNTGWALKAGGGGSPTSTNLVYYNYFSGASTLILHQSPSMDIRWDGINKQLQYYPKFSGWHDAGIMITKGASMYISTDDISSTHNQWFYFTANGQLNTTFNFQSYGNLAHLHVAPEGFNATFPTFRLVAGVGNNSSVWVEIYKNN